MEEKQDVERKEPPRGGSRRSTATRCSPEEKPKTVRLVLEDGFSVSVRGKTQVQVPPGVIHWRDEV